MICLSDLVDVENSQFTTLTLVFASCLLYAVYNLIGNFGKKFPPGPWGLPIVGYIPFLSKMPFIDYAKLSKKYGDIYGMKMGQKYMVIVNSLEGAKEVLAHPSLLNRPPDLSFKDLPDKAGIIMINGPKWHEQRKFSMNALKAAGLGKQKVEDVVQENISSFLEEIESHRGQPIELKDNLTASLVHHLWYLIYGESLPKNEPQNKVIVESLNSTGQLLEQTGLAYFLPWLKPILKIVNGCQVDQKAIFAKYNKTFRDGIDKVKRESAKGSDSKEETYVQQYLNEINKKEKSNFTISTLAGNIEGLFIGAAETTKVGQEWSFLIMAGFPDVQRKIHDLIDNVIGKDRKIYWSDRTLLPYVEAVLMECHRWRLVAPIAGIRHTYENIKLGGFDIPKGSTVLINMWSIHHDPRYWDKPEEFNPTRFLNEKGELMRPPAYMPLTVGKRNCIGEGMATIHSFLYFTAILQKFEIRFPDGVTPNLDPLALKLNLLPHQQELCYIRRT